MRHLVTRRFSARKRVQRLPRLLAACIGVESWSIRYHDDASLSCNGLCGFLLVCLLVLDLVLSNRPGVTRVLRTAGHRALFSTAASGVTGAGCSTGADNEGIHYSSVRARAPPALFSSRHGQADLTTAWRASTCILTPLSRPTVPSVAWPAAPRPHQGGRGQTEQPEPRRHLHEGRGYPGDRHEPRRRSRGRNQDPTGIFHVDASSKHRQ